MKAKKKNISNLSDIEAKRLTSAFMDGNTTLEQESELYRYYSSANIAPELEEFRDMMLWYSNGLKSHSPDNLQAFIEKPNTDNDANCCSNRSCGGLLHEPDTGRRYYGR